MSEQDSLTMDQVGPPVNPPDGTWRCTIISGKVKHTKAGGNPNAPSKKWLFACQATEAGEDVSETEIDARGPVEGYSTAYYEIPKFDSRATWALKKFAIATGMQDADMEGVYEDDLPELLKGREIFLTGSEVYIEGYDDPKWEVSGYGVV